MQDRTRGSQSKPEIFIRREKRDSLGSVQCEVGKYPSTHTYDHQLNEILKAKEEMETWKGRVERKREMALFMWSSDCVRFLRNNSLQVFTSKVCTPHIHPNPLIVPLHDNFYRLYQSDISICISCITSI